MTRTPGPWRMTAETQTERGRMWGINAYENQSGIGGNARLAEVFSIEDNARLIAAAPDLLEAAKWVLLNAGYESGQAEPTLRELNVSIKHLDALRAAVAKAEGRTDA